MRVTAASAATPIADIAQRRSATMAELEPTEHRSRRRDRWAAAILVVCAVGAAVATIASLGDVADASGPARLTETWRLVALPVFAGLFVMLARSPRGTAGLWELVIANKIALVIAGATYLSDIDGSADFVVVDGVLVVFLVATYVLSRGWTAWSDR